MAMSPLLSSRRRYDSGPRSLEVWNYIEEISDPNTGLVECCSLHLGTSVGWSEVAVTGLSLFFGLLTLAWVYRTGATSLAPTAGHFRCAAAAPRVLSLAYMIHARAFTLVALFTTLNEPVSGPTGDWPCTRATRQRRTGGFAARQHRPALFALLLACFCLSLGPVPSALRSRRPAAGGSQWHFLLASLLPCWPCCSCLPFCMGWNDGQSLRKSCIAGPVGDSASTDLAFPELMTNGLVDRHLHLLRLLLLSRAC